MDDDLKKLFDPTTAQAFESARRTPEGWFLRADAFYETHLALHDYRKKVLPEKDPDEGALIQQSSLQRGEMLVVCCAIECYMKGLSMSASKNEAERREVIKSGHYLSNLAETMAARGIGEFAEAHKTRLSELTTLRLSALIYPAPTKQEYNAAHAEAQYQVTLTGTDLEILWDLRRRVRSIRGQ